MEIRGICPPQLQRAALEAGAFSLAHLYYHAPADVRDGLILRLMETPSPHEAACLMECLAMQGDDLALEILLELERHPAPLAPAAVRGPFRLRPVWRLDL